MKNQPVLKTGFICTVKQSGESDLNYLLSIRMKLHHTAKEERISCLVSVMTEATKNLQWQDFLHDSKCTVTI